MNNDKPAYKLPEAVKIIELARKELNYSDKTYSGDIFISLFNVYSDIKNARIITMINDIKIQRNEH